MGRFVIYNGKTGDLSGLCTAPDSLEKGKRYEVMRQTLDLDYNVLTLKGIEGVFDVTWFDECGESNLETKVMKPCFLAEAIIYTNNVENCLGNRMKIVVLDEDRKRITYTTPVQNVEWVYGTVYKIETENSVYITDILMRF